MILVCEHKTEDKRLFLSVFDKELKGKTFEEDNKQIDLSVKYYENNREVKEEELLKLVRFSYSVEFIGKESVEFAIKKRLIEKESTKSICNVPYSQSLFLRKGN